MTEKYTIRRECEADYRTVEYLTREAFWNKYRPGCCEHYILNRFRNDPDFVSELDYVLEADGEIIAHIMYSRAKIKCDDGSTFDAMTFGPVSVLPEYQNQGFGSRLIRFSLEEAEKMGCKVVAITGKPDYYSRFGFVSGHSKNIFYEGVERTDVAPFFMVKELEKGALEGVVGTFSEPAGYSVNEGDVDEFDKAFPEKKKLKLPGQLG